MTADDVPMDFGADSQFLIFRVIAAQEDAYWFAQASESHLRATLGVIREVLPEGRNRIHVVTLVHYKNRSGWIYFNVIRPFHHLVVGAMVRHAASNEAVRHSNSKV